MVTRLGLLCVSLIIFHSTACGQVQEPPKAVTQVDLDALRQELNDNMKTQIEAAISTLSAKIDASSHHVDSGSHELEPVTPSGEDHSLSTLSLAERVAKLERDLRRMQGVQGNHGATLSQIAALGDTGYHIRFDTNSQSARAELNRAIKSTIPPQGRFIIRNRTGSDQYMAVNGYEYRIPPYKRRSVSVRPGTVVSRLRGQQRYTWHVGVPDFTQVVEIHQSEPQYVAQWVGF
jgi:hypothetical protein